MSGQHKAINTAKRHLVETVTKAVQEPCGAYMTLVTGTEVQNPL